MESIKKGRIANKGTRVRNGSVGCHVMGEGPAIAAPLCTHAVDWPWHFSADIASSQREVFSVPFSATGVGEFFETWHDGHEGSDSVESVSGSVVGSQVESVDGTSSFVEREQQEALGFEGSRSRSRVVRHPLEVVEF